jgi:LysM repeat protein
MNREDLNRQKTESTRRRVGRATIQEKTESTGGLPPRSEIHHQKREKKRKKQTFPLIRLQVVFFILLPIIIFVIYTNRDSIFPSSSKTVSEEKSGYETISIDNSDSEKKSKSNDTKADTKDNNVENEKETVEESNNNGTPVQPQPEVIDETKPTSPVEESTASEGVTTPAPNQNVSGVSSQAENNVEVKHHTVQAGETLYRIAMKYYQSKSGIEIIKKANNLKNENISVGQVLTIPMNK